LQFTYKIHTQSGENISRDILDSAIRKANIAVKGAIKHGRWSLFYPPARQDIGAYPTEVTIGNCSYEAIEAKMVEKTDNNSKTKDFWRISKNGLSTIARAYSEDSISVETLKKHTGVERKNGTWLDLSRRIQEVAELVLHSQAMLEHFPSAENIEYLCEYHGLNERLLIMNRDYQDEGEFIAHTGKNLYGITS